MQPYVCGYKIAIIIHVAPHYRLYTTTQTVQYHNRLIVGENTKCKQKNSTFHLFTFC